MGLKVAFIQSSLYWESPDENLNAFDAKIQKIKDVDLIILPEMFSTGFSMNVEELAEEMNGKTFHKMHEWASSSNAVIAGSYIVKVVDRFYNRLLLINPDGTYDTYDKKHLFSLGKEDKHFSAGDSRLICDIKGWKVCPMICYDLRFPVWCRNGLITEREANYDLLLFVANWPDKRIDAWDSLLAARSIENQSYVLGVNRVGTDGNGVPHSGHSSLYDPNGKQICCLKDEEAVLEFELDEELLLKSRRALPFLRDADEFRILGKTLEKI